MLSDASISKLSLLASFFGILSFLLISFFYSPQPVSVSEIDESFLGKNISLKEKIFDSSYYNNTLILFLGEEKFKAVLFSPSENQRIALRKGSIVQVSGFVKKYNGELELVISSVG